MTPAVHREMQDLFHPRHVVCGPVEFAPRTIPVGTRTVFLGDERSWRGCGVKADFCFEILDTQCFSSIHAVERIAITSNLIVLDAYRFGCANPLATLGAAVLCAEEFDVLLILIQAPQVAGLTEAHKKKLHDLLFTVNICLEEI